MIRFGWDRVFKRFTYLDIHTDRRNIEHGIIVPTTNIKPIVVSYNFVGFKSTTLYDPYKNERILEKIQLLFNTCTDETDAEPDVLDYLMRRYIGVGDAAELSKIYRPATKVTEISED